MHRISGGNQQNLNSQHRILNFLGTRATLKDLKCSEGQNIQVSLE